jgi:hypothetical protein
MINFSELKLVTSEERDIGDNFVGIRKSSSTKGFEFCLPNGFDKDNFDGNFNQIRDLFFKLYRTFNKFEKDNKDSDRFKINQPEYQKEQDQTTLSSGGVTFATQDGEPCVLYSKIKMIERVLSAYNDLAIHSIQKKISHTEKIDYSQIYKYLDRAIYLDDDIIHVEKMNLPRAVVRYESTDLIDLYCFILDEIIQQLEEDVPDNVKSRTQDIKFFAERFKDNYLSNNQSIFDSDTYAETINILKESLDQIDHNTFYKDADYWELYEAIEIFLYGELDSSKSDGEYWGVKGFSLVWEDICHTYFFSKYKDNICYADTDIVLRNHQNYQRTKEQENRVGNYSTHDGTKDWGGWIFVTTSNIEDPDKKGYFGWNELLCIELDNQPATFVYNYPQNSNFTQRNRKKALRRFPRPDIVLNFPSEEIWIIDFKNVPYAFFEKNVKIPFDKTQTKYRIDVIKELTYELAIQQTHKVAQNWFLIPCHTESDDFFINSELDIKGIKVIKANFDKFQSIYLSENP